jgi:hypothetical protein
VDPGRLRDILAELKAAGVSRAKLGEGECLEVEFDRAPVPSHGLVDPTTGHPVDLDEGAPETAQADLDDKIRSANFPAPKPKAEKKA